MNKVTMNLTPSLMRAYNVSDALIRKTVGMTYCLLQTDGSRAPRDKTPFESIMRCYQNGDLTLKEVATLIPLCNQAPWVWVEVLSKIHSFVFEHTGKLERRGSSTHFGRELFHARSDVGLRNIIQYHLDNIPGCELIVATALSDFSINGVEDSSLV